MRIASPRVLIVGGLLAIGVIFILLAVLISSRSSDLPDGWDSFSEGPFSGGIQDAWIATYADFADFDFSDLPSDFPETFRENVEAIQASGQVEKVLLVYLDQEEPLATNINILSCEAAESAVLIDTTEEVINLYGRNLVQAEAVGKVVYDGAEYDLIRLYLVEEFDSYQVYLKTDDCYTAATLTTRAGDTAQIDSFREFLSHLEIDVSELG
jgi:hypothetical protein